MSCSENSDKNTENNCNSSCKSWQNCNTVTNLCELKEGMCEIDTDCTDSSKTKCNNNICEFDSEKCQNEINALEEEIKSDLANAETDADFTLKVITNDGKVFLYSKNTSTETTSYESASTSKWISAAVILNLVKKSVLSLDDNPQKYISSWPTEGNLSKITLRHLLSFTSGLSEEPLCINAGGFDFENCVNKIAENNLNTAVVPGSEFYYASTHLQVAGLMAIKAGNYNSWTEVFDEFKEETNLFPHSVYDLPSTTNPRLAGGMHWIANDYLDFLKALLYKEILTEDLINQMLSDQIQNTTVVYSPAVAGLNEDWHYGFGNWNECHNQTHNCTEIIKVSSPGAYGAYPFIDLKEKYYGILARQGELGTFTKGYELFESISAKLDLWATKKCQ